MHWRHSCLTVGRNTRQYLQKYKHLRLLRPLVFVLHKFPLCPRHARLRNSVFAFAATTLDALITRIPIDMS